MKSCKNLLKPLKDDGILVRMINIHVFEIPVLFTLEGTETNARGLITLVGQSPGFSCRSDNYFMERFEKFRNKGKKMKALDMLDQLIRRDPYNNTLYDLKRQLLEGETD